MKTILFVCTGNICRSPMAEGLFKAATKGRGDYRVISAGLGAADGQPPSANAVLAVRELGIDISNQRSRMLTTGLVEQADYIFGMTHSHIDTVVMLYPQAAEKTFLLREFDETLDVYEKDISDPIGGSLEIYIICRDQIEQGIAPIIKFLEQQHPGGGAKLGKVVLGADHGGYELKRAIALHLDRKHIRYTDLGVNSKEPADYPDFARAVAEAVVEQRAELGVLICTTGIGMSIAANKVPGARAALVTDPEGASLARRHNDANVLCLAGKKTSPEQAGAIVEAFLTSSFEGGRHERRVNKIEKPTMQNTHALRAVDPEVAALIESETLRQQENIELIASENFTSPAVMEAQGSVLTNKYAEGYPRKRWYGGCENVDGMELLAIDRAKKSVRGGACQRTTPLRQRREHGRLFRLPETGR